MAEREAIFVTDVVQVEFLLSAAGARFEGCWKIPLSLQAYGLLLRKGAKHVRSYIDFVDFESSKRWYLDEGLQHSRNWLRELGLGFELEDIDLAELDAPCQFLLFTHLRFLERTAGQLIQNTPGIDRFYVIEAREPLAHEFYFDSDVAAAVLYAVCERLQRSVELITMEERPFYAYPQYRSRPITETAPGVGHIVAQPAQSPRIGFVPATVAEAESLWASIRGIPSQTFLFPSTWNPGLISQPDNFFRLSDADGPWSQRIAARLDRLYEAFRRCRERSSLPEAIVRNPRLDFQFEYIIRRRWRAYANMIERAKQYVRDVPLDLFIHSDHFTAEGAILSRLYARRRTPVLIALHSSYPCDRNWASWRSGDRAMAPSLSAAQRLRKISPITETLGIGDPSARKLQSLRARSRSAGLKKEVAGDRKLVLVVINALELNCVPFVDLKKHFEAMAVLAELAETLRGRAVVALRTKPGWSGDDAVLYETVSGFRPEITLEEASFSQCIRMADCIVGVNVATGGYYEILQKGAPLIHFQNAEVISQQPDLPPEAIMQVTRFEALCPAVESVLFDEEFAAGLLAKQRSFAARDLAAEFSEPGDAVQAVLKSRVKRGWQSVWRRRAGTVSEPNAEVNPAIAESSLEISTAAVAGSLDDILVAANGHGKAIGWAADVEAESAAKAVHVFADGRRIGGGKPELERPDVAAYYGNSRFLKTGYQAYFRLETPEQVESVRVYAEMYEGGFHLLSRSF